MNQKKDRAKIEALAEKYIKKEKYEEAILEYQKLITGDEQDVQIWTVIGDLYIKANKKDKAVAEFKKIADHFEKRGIYTKSIAIYKRISRIAPDDIQSQKKLADLYRDRGFISEARAEYSNLAEKQTKKKQPDEAIKTYNKLLKLDSNDVKARLNLAELLIGQKQNEQAVEELNEAAEYKMRKNALKEAGDILQKARSLDKENSRTLENLIVLYKRDKKKKEALKLVNEILKKDKENLNALSLLGNLCFENSEFKKAEDVFKKILSVQPNDVEAMVRLGRIHICNNKCDKAFELYEPLIDALIKKDRDDKAIGLLGLILTDNRTHLPTLEKLADIYREKEQKKSLEIVARRLMKVYTSEKMEEKAKSLQTEFPGLEIVEKIPEPEVEEKKAEPVEDVEPEAIPQETEEAAAETEDAEPEGVKPEAAEPAEVGLETAEPEEAEKLPDERIATDLEQADQLIRQGLIRNAKKILEELKSSFPDEPRIDQKIQELGAIASQVKETEIGDRIEDTTGEDTERFEGGEKLTSAEIFSDTDIVPLVTPEMGEKKYFDLSPQLEEELKAIKHIFYQQTRGDTTVVEKELSAIVADFNLKVDEKIGTADLEARYNLGIAYLEQDLLDEAIKEFMLASQEEKWEMESFTNLGEAYKRKNQLNEAIKWYEKALELTERESIQSYVLKYEIALLYEANKDFETALQLYGEIMEWNSEYGDVMTRIKNIEKQAYQ